jgi:hypothetical protein
MNEPTGAGSAFVLAGRPVGNICPAATLPTNPHSLVKLVKINRACEQQEARGDEVLASPCGIGEPATGDDSGALDADVVAALSHVAEMIN